MDEASGSVTAVLLAAGAGTRLAPLTDEWPKPLMPVGGRPLLQIWLDDLWTIGVRSVVVNVHHHRREMLDFLNRPRFRNWVRVFEEERLLGTAGTLRACRGFLVGGPTLLAHADNLCRCHLADFVAAHRERPGGHVATMMTFDTETPESCGIVETDAAGTVVAFHEKAHDPPGRRANGAVYLLQPEVLDWLDDHPGVTDFSTGVVPEFLGRIGTWHNVNVHRDIGTPAMLAAAQNDPDPRSTNAPTGGDDWDQWFKDHPIHQMVGELGTGGGEV